MNITEQTVGKKLTFPKYHFEKYPLKLWGEDGQPLKVNSDEEFEAAIAKGFSEEAPLIRNVVPPANMTTAPGIQASYDSLKKQYEDTVKEFNKKYAALKATYETLLQEHEEFLLASMK